MYLCLVVSHLNRWGLCMEIPVTLYWAEFDHAKPQLEHYSPLFDFIIHIVHASVLHLGLPRPPTGPNNIAAGAFTALEWPHHERWWLICNTLQL